MDVKRRKEYTEFLAQSLPEFRKILGMSQEQFAFELGLSRSTIGNIESGRQKMTWTVFLAAISVLMSYGDAQKLLKKKSEAIPGLKEFLFVRSSTHTKKITDIRETREFKEELELAGEEAAKHVLLENNDRVLALNDNFEALYDVNLETGQYYSYIKGQTYSEKIFTRMSSSTDFFADSEANTEIVVYPSDKDVVNRLLNRDNIGKFLDRRKHYDRYFRVMVNDAPIWFKMRLVYKNADMKNVIIGVFNAEEEIAIKHKEDKFRETLIRKMIGDDGLFIIDCVGNIRHTVHDNCHGSANYTDKDTYTDSITKYVNNSVVEADREKMREATSPEYMLERLKKEEDYTVEYRDISTGVQRFYEMRVARFSDTEVLQSFAEKDREIISKLIFEKIEDDFFALFGVDLDSGVVQILKNTYGHLLGEEGTVTPYSPVILKIASSFTGETKEFFERISNVEYLKRRFLREDKATYIYQSKLGSGNQWSSVTELVLARHKDGTPSMLSLAFGHEDSRSAGRQEVQNRLKEDMEMIGGLASGYHALYYFNIQENIFKIYSLEGQRLRELQHYVKEECDPQRVFLRFGLSELVHPDDRHLFEALTVDSVKEILAHRKKATIRFRRNIEGQYLWTEMDIIKYEDKDEPANAIALGFAVRDAEIRSEQALNSCLDILSKEMVPAEAIDKLLKMAGEFYGAERAYIFEYEGNREVISNTYEWCADGIGEVKSKLQKVPSSEIVGWEREFKKQGAFYMSSLDDDSAYSSEEGRELLEMQGISSLIAAPIVNGDEIVGFIGVDNPKKATNNIEVLKYVAVVTYSEILKGKQTELVMYESAKEFADAFLDSYISVYYINLADCSYVVINRTQELEERYGELADYYEAICNYIEDCVYPEDRGKMFEAVDPDYIREHLKTEKSFSIHMRDIAGEQIRWYRFDVTRGADENHAGLAFSDVTELLEEENRRAKQLEEALDAAEKANRSKSSFLFNMSHDIRTPMNAISGFTCMAKKYVEDKEKVLKYLDKIDISGKQLLILINQVLEMARIESGKIELEEKAINIRERFNSMVTVLAEQAKENGLKFRHTLKDVVHFHVLTDDARMASITLNIVGNAMKYTPKGGLIDFELKEIEPRKRGKASYTMTVTDTGIGMSEEFQEVLFEPFSREKSTTVSKIQGTGLGLAIVRNLVELLGGEIKVDSKLGAGTRFEVTIDMKIDEAVNQPKEILSESKEVSLLGCRMLLVEDNEMNREIAMDILEENGMQVEIAEDGDVAVEMIRKRIARGDYTYYDCILMDVQMPRMDGYEATRQIRAIPVPENVHIPIVAMTANAFDEDRLDALAAGMDEHVPKPIKVRELLRTLRKVLGR